VRLVVDTNVMLSGLLWYGAPHSLLACLRDGDTSLVESPQLLAELEDVMYRPKFSSILARSGLSSETILQEIRQIAELVIPEPLPSPVCRDPDDDEVLALAYAAQADLIVSGDADLLDLQEYQGIPIVTAAKAMKIIESVRRGK